MESCLAGSVNAWCRGRVPSPAGAGSAPGPRCICTQIALPHCFTYLSVAVRPQLRHAGSRRTGFSLVEAHRLSSCDPQAELLRGRWDSAPQAGVQPASDRQADPQPLDPRGPQPLLSLSPFSLQSSTESLWTLKAQAATPSPSLITPPHWAPGLSPPPVSLPRLLARCADLAHIPGGHPGTRVSPQLSQDPPAALSEDVPGLRQWLRAPCPHPWGFLEFAHQATPKRLWLQAPCPSCAEQGAPSGSAPHTQALHGGQEPLGSPTPASGTGPTATGERVMQVALASPHWAHWHPSLPWPAASPTAPATTSVPVELLYF